MMRTKRHATETALIAGGAGVAAASTGLFLAAGSTTATLAQAVGAAPTPVATGTTRADAGDATTPGAGEVRGHSRGLTVTAVSGNAITARDRNGRMVTVQVGASTTYATAGGGAVAASG